MDVATVGKDYVQNTAEKQRIPEQDLIDTLAADMALKRIWTDDVCARAALFLTPDYDAGCRAPVEMNVVKNFHTGRPQIPPRSSARKYIGRTSTLK